jgi:Heterokaryon incompatibility protein (HET)
MPEIESSTDSTNYSQEAMDDVSLALSHKQHNSDTVNDSHLQDVEEYLLPSWKSSSIFDDLKDDKTSPQDAMDDVSLSLSHRQHNSPDTVNDSYLQYVEDYLPPPLEHPCISDGWEYDETSSQERDFGGGCLPDCILSKLSEEKQDDQIPQIGDDVHHDITLITPPLYTKIGEHSIRILVLEPGPFGSTLSANMVVVGPNREDVPSVNGTQQIPYIALSYSWGPPVFPYKIEINGISTSITVNLYAFLQHFRHASKQRHLWIDALCINQLDSDEKSVQVQKMFEIYRNAELVIVWLGEHGRHTKWLMNYLSTVSQLLANPNPNKSFTLHKEHLVQDVHCKECFRKGWFLLLGIRELLDRSWIRRIWVKQEVWAAENITVRCGTSQISWDTFKLALDLSLRRVRHISPPAGISEGTLQGRHLYPEQLACARGLRRRTDPVSEMYGGFHDAKEDPHEIIQILKESVACLSTDPRDRIYGLLGIASMLTHAQNPDHSRKSTSLLVDYNISTEEVFHNLTRYLIYRQGIGPVLTLGATFGNRAGLDIATWSPDWRYSCWTRIPNLFMDGEGQDASFIRRSTEARDQLQKFREFQETCDWSDMTLRAHGLVVGHVEDFVATNEHWKVPMKNWINGEYWTPTENMTMMASCSVSSQLSMDQNAFVKTCHYLEQFVGFVVPEEASKGDTIIMLETGQIPLIFRERATEDGELSFVGPAFPVDDCSGLIAYAMLDELNAIFTADSRVELRTIVVR